MIPVEVAFPRVALVEQHIESPRLDDVPERRPRRNRAPGRGAQRAARHVRRRDRRQPRHHRHRRDPRHRRCGSEAHGRRAIRGPMHGQPRRRERRRPGRGAPQPGRHRGNDGLPHPGLDGSGPDRRHPRRDPCVSGQVRLQRRWHRRGQPHQGAHRLHRPGGERPDENADHRPGQTHGRALRPPPRDPLHLCRGHRLDGARGHPPCAAALRPGDRGERRRRDGPGLSDLAAGFRRGRARLAVSAPRRSCPACPSTSSMSC